MNIVDILLLLFFVYSLTHIVALTLLLIPIYTNNKYGKFFLRAKDFKKHFNLNNVGIIVFYTIYLITAPLFAVIPYLTEDANVL